MPWVSTELWLADVTDAGRLANPVRIAGGDAESLFQPEWSPDGGLYFVSDRTNWWNLYRWQDGQARALCPLAAEFGEPQWVFGMSTYAFADTHTIVCAYKQRGLGKLATLDVATGRLTPIDLPYTDFSAVRVGEIALCFVSARRCIRRRSCRLILPQERQVLRTASPVADQPEIRRYLTQVRPVEFKTTNGKTAFGLFYPPHNPDFQPSEGEKPPLLVKVHGGPTGSASSTLDLRIQYWTSRGIAVLDVNYGGSTGFGREYRERLRGEWGVVDVDDCINGARSLSREGEADENRAVITGGSGEVHHAGLPHVP